jgi:hypothetical protein
MSDFEGSSFKKQVMREQKQIKEFIVPDQDSDSQYPTSNVSDREYIQSDDQYNVDIDLEAKVAQARKEKQSPQISERGRKRIEILANIGRLTKEVEVEGVVFSLRTLKSKEVQAATCFAVLAANDIAAGFEMRRRELAMSIFEIDHNPVEMIIGSNTFEAKLQMVDNFSETLVRKLNQEYTDLKAKSFNSFGIKNEADAKDVIEDIKK